MRRLDYAFATAVALGAVCAPYTKVEETFFMQAVHDVLRWGRVNGDFDHLEFPGVVPRSFVGPLAVAALAFVPARVAGGTEGVWLQVLVRVLLGALVAWANSQLRAEIERVFGRRAAWWYGVLCVCQFHYTFWTSRLLGNTLALVPMLLAQKYWLRSMWSDCAQPRQRSYRAMAAILAATCTVLRFDVAVFAAAMLASAAPSATWRAVGTAAAALGAAGALTLAVDSHYWQTSWMWPELRVFWFNVVQGRSAEWGVSPPHHYFTHSLPRLLLGALPLACVGVLVDARAARLAAAYAAAIVVFSVNAHKEWRFIMPAVPVLNACAAVGAARLRQSRRAGRLAAHAVVVLSGLSFLAAAAMTYVSSLNYPGGDALALLHTLETEPGARVHIDTYAAMTGASRFGQLRPDWAYSRAEGLGADQYANFTHLLTSQPERHSQRGFEVIAVQPGYTGMHIIPLSQIAAAVKAGQLPLTIRQEPLVWIMRRTEDSSRVEAASGV
ncbi:hypothetical protein IWQ57_001273 [Coemansia nantahalensis]|uniref:Uncharacterized protein n=1 Tax=Coemansia nantahalensis TaxID=2789366 RepID=A0ACC1K524_9FUNG|nr:hypothetical protein IWQ57_001273 [Coemansia nantahalensis]